MFDYSLPFKVLSSKEFPHISHFDSRIYQTEIIPPATARLKKPDSILAALDAVVSLGISNKFFFGLQYTVIVCQSPCTCLPQ